MRFKNMLISVFAAGLLLGCVPDETGTGAVSGAASSVSDVSGIRIEHANPRNRPTTVSSPTRTGDTALMFSVSDGQCAGNRTFDDCGSGRARSEIVDRSSVALNREEWYAFSVFVSEGTRGIDPANLILAQWQDTRGSGEITLGFNLYRADGIIITQDDPTTQQVDDMRPPPLMVDKTIVPPSRVNNRWHDIRVQAVWSTGENGLINVWVNDRLVHSHTGRNLNRDVAPSFKFGVYWSGLQKLSNPAPTQTLIFDHVRRGQSEAEVRPPAG